MELVTRSASLSSSVSFLRTSNSSFPEFRRRSSKHNVIPIRRRSDIHLDLDVDWIHSRINVSETRASSRRAEVRTSVTVAEEVEISNSNRFEVFEGTPTPFGATARDGGINFAIYSGNAVSATLCLINLFDLQKVKSKSSRIIAYTLSTFFSSPSLSQEQASHSTGSYSYYIQFMVIGIKTSSSVSLDGTLYTITK